MQEKPLFEFKDKNYSGHFTWRHNPANNTLVLSSRKSMLNNERLYVGESEYYFEEAVAMLKCLEHWFGIEKLIHKYSDKDNT